MKTGRNKLIGRRRVRKGITLIELAVTCTISVIPLTAISVMVVGGQRDWERMYQRANRITEIEGHGATAIFGHIGRISYSEYSQLLSVGDEAPVLSMAPGGGMLESGQVVVFRFWDQGAVSLGHGGPGNVGSSRLPNRYARFYHDTQEKTLVVELGLYPGSQRDIVPQILAENVTSVRFDRTEINNSKQGCIRMEMTLTDPSDGRKSVVMATTLLRN
ncbi:MAG: hypothetical protein KAR47_13785 [Planctomycetes bacterium]|nr:hypothetical protein [Planctomycetota bacterium]